MWCAGRDLNPGHELGRLRCYPYITDAKAFEKRLALNGFGPEVLQERYLAEDVSYTHLTLPTIYSV